MKKIAVAAKTSQVAEVAPRRERARKKPAATPAGLNVRLQLLQNSRCVMVQGRWWWPWKAAIWLPTRGVLPEP